MRELRLPSFLTEHTVNPIESHVEMKHPATLNLTLAGLFLYAMSTLAQTTTYLSSTLSTTTTPLIGPLTTLFTPPASCVTSEAITTGNENNTFFLTQSLFNNGPSGAPMVQSECFPSNYTHDQFQYYSPGVCPSGWVLNTSPSIQSRFAPSTQSGETVGICCPPRYTYQDGPLGCTSYMAQATSGSVLSPSYFIYFGYGVPSTLVRTLSVSDITVTISEITSLTITTGAVFTVSTGTIGDLQTITTTNVLNSTLIISTIAAAGYLMSSYTQTSASTISYTQISASTIFSTSNIAPGTVYASGIQVRWTGEYPLNQSPSPTSQSPGLSSGAKAGIGLGVVVAVFLLVCIVAWFLLRRRAKRRKIYVSHEPAWEKPYAQTGKGELPAPSPTNEHLSPRTPGVAGTEDGGYGYTEIESHPRISGQQAYVTSILNSPLAELGSLRSDSSLKRKPVSTAAEIDSGPALTLTRDTTVAAPVDPNKPLPTPLEGTQLSRKEEQPEQGSVMAISSKREDSTSSRGETISKFGEEERLRAELARVVERKERIRELQRLKEEEERLVKIEEELRQQIGADVQLR